MGAGHGERLRPVAPLHGGQDDARSAVPAAADGAAPGGEAVCRRDGRSPVARLRRAAHAPADPAVGVRAGLVRTELREPRAHRRLVFHGGACQA